MNAGNARCFERGGIKFDATRTLTMTATEGTKEETKIGGRQRIAPELATAASEQLKAPNFSFDFKKKKHRDVGGWGFIVGGQGEVENGDDGKNCRETHLGLA